MKKLQEKETKQTQEIETLLVRLEERELVNKKFKGDKKKLEKEVEVLESENEDKKAALEDKSQ